MSLKQIKSAFSLRMVSVGLTIALCIVCILFLGSDFRKKLNTLASANADSIQWTIAQLDVELLAMETAIHRAHMSGEPDLTSIRQRFDIFYSRVETFGKSGLYQYLRADPEVARHIDDMRAFLDAKVPLMDGPDEALRASLHPLAAEAEALRSTVRALSIRALRYFSVQADLQREHVAQLLLRIAGLTSALIVALIIMVTFLVKLNRENRYQVSKTLLSSRRLKAVVANSNDAILVAERNGEVLDFNGSAECIFGFSRDDALGQDASGLIFPEPFASEYRSDLNRFLETGESAFVNKGIVRLEAKRGDGTPFPVEMSTCTISGRNGDIFLSFIRDISLRVKAETELLTARDKAIAGEKAKAEFLAVMSHEMRTPLNGLLGTLELLDDTDLTDDQKSYAKIMRSSGQLLLHHVNDVLDISRSEAGKMDIAHMPFDLNKMLTELVTSQKPVADCGGNRLEIARTDPALNLILGDQIRLRQVVLNLVSNALKFTRGGSVSLECSVADTADRFEISVSDTGIGISPDDQEKVFEDFVTLNAAYDRRAGGTGLGLGISRRLARAMGGDITVQSTAGKGSTFRLTLPLDKPAAPPVPETPVEVEERATAHGVKVLVIEDNEINRIVVRGMLEKDGHHVTEAFNGKLGAEAAGREAFDLILTDISMPEMDGVACTEAIRASGGPSADVPIVALTAHALPAEIARFKAAGIDDTLIKPISRKALRLVIGQALGARGPLVLDDARIDDGLLEAEALDNLRDSLPPAHLARLSEEFLAETESELARLATPEGMAPEDPAFAKDVHRLAGSAAVFGAAGLRAILTDVERRALEGDHAGAKAAFETIPPVWSKTRTSLRAALSEAA